jgi:hypothetical protein
MLRDATKLSVIAGHKVQQHGWFLFRLLSYDTCCHISMALVCFSLNQLPLHLAVWLHVSRPVEGIQVPNCGRDLFEAPARRISIVHITALITAAPHKHDWCYVDGDECEGCIAFMIEGREGCAMGMFLRRHTLQILLEGAAKSSMYNPLCTRPFAPRLVEGWRSPARPVVCQVKY